ncbi:hypothetical protein [Tardiphaga sp. vice352]|nr:hypothetical protein [Tardiphaga sp. vice352]
MTLDEQTAMRVRAAERAHDVEVAFSSGANQAAVKNAEEALKSAFNTNLA